MHELIRYEFDLQFEVPVTYPATPFEIELPELDGKTVSNKQGPSEITSSTVTAGFVFVHPHFLHPAPVFVAPHALTLASNIAG